MSINGIRSASFRVRAEIVLNEIRSPSSIWALGCHMSVLSFSGARVDSDVTSNGWAIWDVDFAESVIQEPVAIVACRYDSDCSDGLSLSPLNCFANKRCTFTLRCYSCQPRYFLTYSLSCCTLFKRWVARALLEKHERDENCTDKGEDKKFVHRI